MDTVEHWAKENGAATITLTTGNAAAAKFYKKIGYNQIGWMGATFEKTLWVALLRLAAVSKKGQNEMIEFGLHFLINSEQPQTLRTIY